MTDWMRLTIDALDSVPGDKPWDVIADVRALPPMLCVCYATAGAAHAALTAAGFTPAREAIDVPPLAPWHDRRSVLKYGRHDGALVVLARRAARTA